jgi:hypothetical protein
MGFSSAFAHQYESKMCVALIARLDQHHQRGSDLKSVSNAAP